MQAELALSVGCRRTLAKIRNLSKRRGFCFARLSTIAKYFDMTERTIRRHVAALINGKFIMRVAGGLAPFLAAECPQNVREMSGPYKECMTRDYLPRETTTTISSNPTPAREPTPLVSSLLIQKTGMTPASAALFAERDPNEVLEWIKVALTRDKPAAYAYSVLRAGFKSPPAERRAAIAADVARIVAEREAPPPFVAPADRRRGLPAFMARQL